MSMLECEKPAMNVVSLRKTDDDSPDHRDAGLSEALDFVSVTSFAGEPSAMTPTERRLFTQLYCQRGRAVSTEQLLLDIWGYDSEIMRHTVDRFGVRTLLLAQLGATVRNLRAKIEESPDTPRYLLSVNGYGYMLARYQQVA